jgi:hypothetical protein
MRNVDRQFSLRVIAALASVTLFSLGGVSHSMGSSQTRLTAPTANPSDCINADDIFCNGFDPIPTIMPGTIPAAIGPPSSFQFNGLGLVTDELHHGPKHAVPSVWSAFPIALADDNKPSIPNVTKLSRRDAAILYVPNVQGAADYRAYIFDPNTVSYTAPINGTPQPRGAVISCAGFRQRYTRNWDALYGAYANAHQVTPVLNRELLQEVEVPGLVVNGTYKIVIEAISSPCPFVGVPAHTNATIPIETENRVPGTNNTLTYQSFDTVRSLYGNEILNGQGSALNDFKNVYLGGGIGAPAEVLGRSVPPNDATFPSDPVVIARSVVSITRPAADEAVNAPLFDVGPNSMWDDFSDPIGPNGSTDALMTSFHAETRSAGAGLVSGGQFGREYYWMLYAERANGDTSTNPKGVQVWQRHGRRYVTFSDWAQDTFGGVYFTPTTTQPLQLDSSKYVHSFWRSNSGAAQRRYWDWMICGAPTRSELADPITGIPAPHFRPAGLPFFFIYDGANNPSALYLENSSAPGYHSKECVGLLQLAAYRYGNKPANYEPTTWIDEPHSELRAFIHQRDHDTGVINLKPAGMGDGDGDGSVNPDGSINFAEYGMLWRLDANKHPTRPMFEPFDQDGVLTHYDVFVRPDRLILFINGRQSYCADLSAHPLTMSYGMPIYGNVLYHSTADISTSYVGLEGTGKAIGGSFDYVMNTPWTTTGVWDAIGQSEKIDIPTQFTFDPAACFPPASWLAAGTGF